MGDRRKVPEEERRDIQASREWFKHNKGIPFEQVVAELGFTIEEVSKLQRPFVKRLVLTDQTRIDLDKLDRATRLRIVAARRIRPYNPSV